MSAETDESYDPHARMHESFPRADSGSTQMAGDVIPLPVNMGAGMLGQAGNNESLKAIAAGGKSAVDKTNLVLGPGMRKPQPK